MTPFDGKFLTSYLMSLVMFALSLTIYEIFANQIKCQNLDLESEGQGGEKHHSTKNVRLHIDDFL